MIIRDLKSVLSKKREATLPELVLELGSDRPMVRAAIDYWRQRGQVEIVTARSEPAGAAADAAAADASVRAADPIVECGGSCGGCVLTPFCASPTILYRWKGSDTGN